ncbi:IniB N-terminal domain-containing protein [Amycolatopsis sacchari]|uniref:IniB N-terminal domain-containing protein n=1 Tax=Amycolatopsis sacchari TaxID=115433 RepID=UPI003EBD5161
MSHPAQNLHDFVLNLLTDDAARSVFAADPTAALERAGLSDVTPQDIQEVAPLVADYAPANAAASLESVLSTLPTGEGLQDTIAHLTAVADAADAAGVLPSLDAPERQLPVSAPTLSGLPVATPELGSTLPLGLPELGQQLPELGNTLPVGDLPLDSSLLGNLPLDGSALSSLPLDGSALGDLPLGDLPLDGSALSGLPLDAAKSDGLPIATSGIEGLNTPQVSGLPVSTPELDLPLLGKVETSTSGTGDGFAGTATYEGDAATGAAGVAAADDSLAVAGTTESKLGYVAGSGIAGADTLAGGLQSESGLGSYGVSAEGTPASLPDFGTVTDLGESLDSDALAKSAPAAGTLADYVSSGGELLGEHVEAASTTIGGYLTGVSTPTGDLRATNALTDAGERGNDAIQDAANHASDQVSQHVPATPALPAPELPTDLPTHLPADLPVHVQAELPGGLPHLPVANPMPQAGDLEHALSAQPLSDSVDVSHNPVSDATSALDHSPLSQVTDLGGLTDDLPFGH